MAILGVGKIIEKAVVDQGKIVPRHQVFLSLTFDHRWIDGALAARILDHIVGIIENIREFMN